VVRFVKWWQQRDNEFIYSTAFPTLEECTEEERARDKFVRGGVTVTVTASPGERKRGA
jgi:hypothetical protein